MFQIDDPSAASVQPTAEAAGTPGWFTEGNPGSGIPATLVRGSWLNNIQAELMSILSAVGIAGSKGAQNQVLSAIKALMQANIGKYAVDTGTVNNVVLTYAPAISALSDGLSLRFKAAAGNTGATTVAVNGLTAQPIVGGNHSALQGGEIVVGSDCEIVWNSTLNAFVLSENSGGPIQVSAGTKSNHAVNLAQFVSSFGSSDYLKLPNGWIIQWGSATSSGAGYAAVTWPTTFPHAAFATVVTAAGGSTSNLSAQTTSATTTGTTVAAINASNAYVAGVTIAYIVIGW